MIQVFILTFLFVGVAVLMLALYAAAHHWRVGQHVSANPALRKRGVGCVQSQDRAERLKKNPEKQ